MNFDISKLDSLPAKAAGAKAKPKFGPAIRARPKPQAKPSEDTESPSVAPSTGAQDTQALKSGSETAEQPPRTDVPDAQPAADTNMLDGATGTVREGQGAAAEQLPVPTQSHRFRPTAGKRKAPEPPGALGSGPEVTQTPTVASPAAYDGALAVVPEEDAGATQPESGPMTKAKKRKGMAKGSGVQKSKTPLAQQKIDPVSMPLKTVIKVACAKDKVKSAAVKAAKAAAAAQSGSQQSSPSTSLVQQDPPTAGVAQMVVDPETGELVIDPNSLTMQAQAPVQFVRREDDDDVLINSMSHMKREATTRWSPEETEEWYLALGIFGTNFQAVADRLNSRMAQQGLPHLRRSRKQVKLKFNKEEKLHPRRIDSTLRGQNAMPEDYIEIIHDIKAARNEVQEDETAYLEDAPDHSAADHQSGDNGTQQATQTQHVPSGQDIVQQQPHLQSHTTGSKAQGVLRARPKVKAGTRPVKVAEAELAGAEQTSRNKADGDASFVRMLEEQNAVNAETWREVDNAY